MMDTPFYVLIPGESIPPSIPTLCNLMFSMFHFGIAFLHSTKEPQHGLPNLAPPKGETASSFSRTSLFKSPTPRISCLVDPTLARLNQVISVSMCETEFCDTKSIPSCDPGVHTRAIFLLTFRKILNQVATNIFLPKSLLDQFSLDDKKFIIEYNKKIPSATKPPNTKTLPHKPKKVSMYFQDEPSTPPSDKPSGDTEEATNPEHSTHVTMIHKSLSQGTEDASLIDIVLSINCQVNAHHTYTFAHKQSCLPQHQLVDRETNGGLAASDMRILQKTGRKLNVVGIGNHELTGLDVATAACPFQSSSGKFVCILHEYAYLGKGSSNHSPGQMEVFKTHVDDKSIKVVEQAAENRGKGTRLVNLKKRVPVVNSIVNYGGDKSTYLTT